MPCNCASPLPVRQTTGAYRCATCHSDCDPPALMPTATASAAVATASSGDEDDADGADAMMDFLAGFGSSEPAAVPHAKLDGRRRFWDLLEVANGPNAAEMGSINLLNGLQDQLRDPGRNNGGLMHIRAVPTEGGWILYGDPARTPGSEPVYFLPWKKGHTVYAKRSWYENSVCEYFLTTKLTGCRFSITREHVLHVAADAYGAKDDASGSGKRTVAEGALTRGVLTRRLSSSGISAEHEEPAYHGLGYVFGMRTPAGWVYKAYVNETRRWTLIWTAEMGSGS